MHSLRFTHGELSLADIEKPALPGESLVRVTHSGICNTDLEIVRGYAGFEGTIGHEFVGLVEASEDKTLVGKRVVGEIIVGCGECDLCRSGDPRHCPTRTVLGIKGRDGAHAEFLTLPARNLLTVPDAVSDEQACFTEPLAAAIGITEQVAITPEKRVAVIGDGKLGILCAMAMGMHTPNTSIIGKHTSKMNIAAAAGVEPILAEKAVGLANSIDVVIEASGSESGFASALDLVRPRGKIVLKSTFHGTPKWEAWRVVVDEITIVGSRCGRFEPALVALATGAVRVDGLISEEFRLEDGVRAMGRAAERGVLKVLLRMAN